MATQGGRPEPVGKLSNFLVVVASCVRCKARMELTFPELAQTEQLSCQGCGLSWDFAFDADALAAMDQNLRHMEDPIRDREAWVEVRPYP